MKILNAEFHGSVLTDDLDMLVIPGPTAPYVFRMDLESPEEFRGRELVMEIPDLKWIEWRLDGLDDPWMKPY